MALRFTAQASKAVLPPGLYPATLANVELRDGVNNSQFLMWFFEVTADGVTTAIGRPTSARFTSGSKARLQVDALLGRHLRDDEEVDLETLYGAACHVLVTVAQLDGGGTVNRIENVLAIPPDEDGIPF